jgi:hypothetical protein
MAEIHRLAERMREVENKLDETKTHCAMAVGEILNLKGIINAKNQKKTQSTTVTLNSRWITSGAGLVEFNQQLAAQKDKKEKLAEAKRKREALVATKRAERDARGPTLAFRGSLTAKTKDDLMDIITALVIPMEAGKRFKKEELIGIIQTHLNTHPVLKDNPRFSGLFQVGGRRSDKENLPRRVANVSTVMTPSMTMPQPFSHHVNITIPHGPSTSSHSFTPLSAHAAHHSLPAHYSHHVHNSYNSPQAQAMQYPSFQVNNGTNSNPF